MAYQLQKITVLFFALGMAAVSSAAPPRRPFSHKYHLTQVPQCESCHTAATTSTAASAQLAVPYLSVGLVGFMIYRGCKKNAEFLAARRASERKPDVSKPHV